ncbi:MAG: hypothetical protein J7K64_04440 [Bacteroidales bacterium]|nr:hypothetical protein [Bacteroidales bacterium]
MLEEAKLQILHDHYLETCQIIRDSIKLRDKLVFLVIVVLAVLIAYSFWPSSSIEALSYAVKEKFGVPLNINPNVLSTIIWISLLAIVMRYTQAVVYIERQYLYIHKIEKSLSEKYNNKAIFTREGVNYLKKYPPYSNWICFIYTTILPVVLLIFVFTEIIKECLGWGCGFSFIILVNSLAALSIAVTIVLYMIFMYKQE